MARAMTTGTTQFIEDSSEVADLLYAQPGFVSEVTCVDGALLFNLETTSPIDPSVVPRLESFTSFLAGRIRPEGSLSRVGTVARALAPMISLGDESMIAEYAARIVGNHLGLDLCQAVVMERGTQPIATWRQPRTRLPWLDAEHLVEAVREKEDFAAWFGPARELTDTGPGAKRPRWLFRFTAAESWLGAWSGPVVGYPGMRR